VRPVPEVGRCRGAEPAEPQVRHVQRLGGTAAAPARDQRVLARRRDPVATTPSGRHLVLPSSTGQQQLLPKLAPTATGRAEDVQKDHLLRHVAGRGQGACQLPTARPVYGRSVRARTRPVFRRFPAIAAGLRQVRTKRCPRYRGLSSL